MNGWRLNRTDLTLDYYQNDRHVYDVDLERCRTSAETLDWIAQVAGKTWCDDAALGQRIRDIDVL